MKDGALFYMLLSIYQSVGELTEVWERVVEYTSSIKSSGTEFYKPDFAFELISKPASGLRARPTFGCDCFWRVMELQWSFYGKIVAILWIQHRGIDREYNFQGKLITPTSHLAPFGMTYNFSGA